MKQSERLMLDAENAMKLIESYRKDVDLRAGQIEKLKQEMISFSELIDKEQLKYEGIIKQVQQEQEKEDMEEENRKKQIAIDIAQSMENNK